MSEFTKGPWTASAVSSIVGSLIQATDDSNVAVAIPQKNKLECEANARLISAAPDLLDACKIALISLRAANEIGFSGDARKAIREAYEHSPEIEALKSAISKAERA